MLDVLDFCKNKLEFRRTLFSDVNYEIKRYITPVLSHFDILEYKGVKYAIKEICYNASLDKVSDHLMKIDNKCYAVVRLDTLTIPFDYREWLFRYIDDLLTRYIPQLKTNFDDINVWFLKDSKKEYFIKSVGKSQLGISGRYAIEHGIFGDYFIVIGKTKKYLVISGNSNNVFMVDHPIKRYVTSGDSIYVNAINQPDIKHDNHSPERKPYNGRGKLIGNKLITFNISPVILNRKQYVYVLGTTETNVVLVGKQGLIETLLVEKAPELKAGDMIEMNDGLIVTRILNNPTTVGNIYEKF